MSYTKDQIIEYLENQDSIKSAISNIDHLDDSESCKIVYNGKEIIYFDKSNVKTNEDVKNLILKYMDENGWERSGYEEIMSLNEVLGDINLKIIK